MNETKKRKLIPRKLKLIPAALLSVIILAVLSLLGLLNFNPPSLNDSTAEQSESENQEENQPPLEQSFVSAEMLTQPAENAAEQTEPLQPMEMVDVLIDGDDYLYAIGMRNGEAVRESRSVAEIVSAVSTTAGDTSGVKVRITRTFDATAQAERTLVSALNEAGLSEDEIDQRRTLVP